MKNILRKSIIILGLIITIIILAVILNNNINKDDSGQSNKNATMSNNNNTSSSNVKSDGEYIEKEKLNTTTEINLYDVDGKKSNYVFTYKDEQYKATYTRDNWHIEDSYKITNKKDIAAICEALIEIHPIHGKDMQSYRTVDDLVYEWEQHNLAYLLLPKNNPWKKYAKDVDLDPADQGRSIEEMYKARTGKDLSLIDVYSRDR